MPNFVTLRKHLHKSLDNLVKSASLGKLGKCSITCELVSLFADYQEEGTSLYLDAYLTNDLKELTRLIPQSDRLPLGMIQCNETAIRGAIKKIAPLARGCWRIYFSKISKGLEFGLFRDSGHPLNVSIDLALHTGGVGDAKYIRVTRLTQDSVRVSIHNGDETVVHFTNAKKVIVTSTQAIVSLAEIICSEIDNKTAQSCKTYLTSLLLKALREAKGSLIAVSNLSKVPAFLNDCTNINPPINLSNVVNAVLREPSAIPHLYALENVICGMFRCDGIVVFDTRANAIAYNAFIKLKGSNIAGGARRRAYEALCGKVGKGLKAAFFQSQDGENDLRRKL
ncbi:MAG: hypothetical protein U1F57_08335 [bacterium]